MKKILCIVLAALLALGIFSVAAFAAAEGWVQEDGAWVYYSGGVKLSDTWKEDSNGWCYLGSDGRMLTNEWILDSVGWCYVGENGYCVTDKWMRDSVGWVYLDSNGRMVTDAWVMDSIGWCYVGADGYAVTNCWKQDSAGWCYLNSEGSMTKNAWVYDGGLWYYLDANGYKVVNCWMADSIGWVYLGANGDMLTNAWVMDSVGWCYVGPDGYALTDTWMRDSVGTCYLDSEGRMVVFAWYTIDGKECWFDENGYYVEDKKLDNDTVPVAPVVELKTDVSVILVAVDGYEYSIDGENWQSAPEFIGLQPATEYSFYQRIAETDTTNSSVKSEALVVITDKSSSITPAAPTLASKTDVSVTLVAVNGCEYSLDGENWQSSPIFEGLNPATQYSFYQRFKETENTYAGDASEALVVTTNMTTPATPAAPTVSYLNDESVTLVAVPGMEYSKDGINWQSSPVFNDLDDDTEYTFYQRVAATETSYTSATSAGTTVKTDKNDNYIQIGPPPGALPPV